VVEALKSVGLFVFSDGGLNAGEECISELARTAVMTTAELDDLIAHLYVAAAEYATVEQAVSKSDRTIKPPIKVSRRHISLATVKYDCTALGCLTPRDPKGISYGPDNLTVLSADAEKIKRLMDMGFEISSPNALHDLVRYIEGAYREHAGELFKSFGRGHAISVQGLLWHLQLSIDKRPGFADPFDVACNYTVQELGIARLSTVGTAEKFDLLLTSAGAQRSKVVLAVRQLTALGLKEARELVGSSPGTVLRKVTREEADRGALVLKATGASVEVRRSVPS
jgi:large subunit ribosomal protein L7/L12